VSPRARTLGRAPRAATGDNTRDIVLDAAQVCFTRYGIAQTTIDDVVRVAKVPRATLYRHAGGKEALLAAVSLRQLDRFLHELVEHLAELDAVADRIVEGALFTIEHYRSDELLTRLLAVRAEPDGSRMLQGLNEQARRRLITATEPWLTAARAAGEIRPDVDVAEYVEWTMRAIGSLVLAPTKRTRAEERAFLYRMLVPPFVPDRLKGTPG
jgi:AcrR family transcriptional regulator